MKRFNIKELLKKGVISLTILIMYIYIIPILLSIIPIKSIELSITIKYSILALIVLYYFRLELKSDFKDFKKNGLTYLRVNWKYYLYGLLGMIILNTIIGILIKNGIPENEMVNRTFFKLYPFAFIYEALLLGPICEELIFRKNFQYINNDKLFIIGTSCIFALTHALTGIKSAYELIYILPYLTLGISFGYIYRKTNNIFSSIVFHIFHNTITLLLLIL